MPTDEEMKKEFEQKLEFDHTEFYENEIEPLVNIISDKCKNKIPHLMSFAIGAQPGDGGMTDYRLYNRTPFSRQLIRLLTALRAFTDEIKPPKPPPEPVAEIIGLENIPPEFRKQILTELLNTESVPQDLKNAVHSKMDELSMRAPVVDIKPKQDIH